MPPDDIKRKPSVHVCPRCTLVNTIENKFCSKCSYPLTASAFEEIKFAEEKRIRTLEEKYQKDMTGIREEMNERLDKIVSLIRDNPILANVKTDVLLDNL